MDDAGRRMAAAVALAATMTTNMWAQSGDGTRTLTLSLENMGNAPAHALSVAKREVSRVYAAVGVATVWVTRSGGDESRTTVHVVLMSEEAAARKARLEGVADAVMGQANRPARRVYVFWHRIAERAALCGCPVGEPLGLVLAHEIGHVLLPENSHSAVGIMKPGLGVGKDVGLRFTDAQGHSIRQTLSAPVAYR